MLYPLSYRRLATRIVKGMLPFRVAVSIGGVRCEKPTGSKSIACSEYRGIAVDIRVLTGLIFDFGEVLTPGKEDR